MRVETIGPATLYHGDCREVLPLLTGVDIVLTDPPYGEYTHKNAKSNKPIDHGYKHGVNAIDFDAISEDDFIQLCRDLCGISRRWVLMTCDWSYMSALEQTGLLVRHGVGIKTNPMPQISGDRPCQGWEAIAMMHRPGKKHWNGGGKSSVYTMRQPSIDRVHPTQKDVSFYAELLRDFSDAGELVLDPFMGSGASGMAAIQLGRRYVGIERDVKYFDAACRRIEDAVYQQSLLTVADVPRQQVTQGALL